ncbi:MAG: anhydro-N-acetylmuramic acid kinase [Candidatus Comchoanobacterales bacterium]
MLVAGVMVGSSLDGIDVVAYDTHEKKLIDSHCFPIPNELRLLTLAVVQGKKITAYQMGALQQQWTMLCVQAVQSISQPITLVGVHGPTLAHAPNDQYPFSWQCVDAITMSNRLTLPVVSDFRQRDIVSGGQGAPLAPLFHQALLPCETDAVVNLGGVANITLLNQQPIIGFDVGPANGLLDELALTYLKQPYDQDGQWASEGVVQQVLLQRLMKEPFVHIAPPKSTGRCYFNTKWLASFTSHEKPQDIAATLCYWTALLLKKHLNGLKNIYFCGGGVYHQVLMSSLREVLDHPCPTTDELGLPAQWLEAIGFAWLAEKRHLDQAMDLSTITGGSIQPVGELVYPS